LSFQEYAKSQELVLGDARTDDLHYVINDFLSVEGYSITTDQVEYLAVFNRGASKSNPHLRIAYVTTDPKIIAAIKMANALSSFTLKTFPTVADARAWCNTGR
jgi:hypothetical protein